jgi:hypothetical protein
LIAQAGDWRYAMQICILVYMIQSSGQSIMAGSSSCSSLVYGKQVRDDIIYLR